MHHRVLLPALLAFAFAAAPARAADPAAGQRVYNQCRACHTIDANGRNGVGPNLFGIIGAPAARSEGFRYSNAMRERATAGLTWTEENMRAYLTNPREFLPGGSMAFAGLRNQQQLDDLIAFLNQAK